MARIKNFRPLVKGKINSARLFLVTALVSTFLLLIITVAFKEFSFFRILMILGISIEVGVYINIYICAFVRRDVVAKLFSYAIMCITLLSLYIFLFY